jgi:thymidylate synthase (FAD)
LPDTQVKPEVYLIAHPWLDWREVGLYLDKVGGMKWLDSHQFDQDVPDAEDLVEFAAKMCYRAWEPGLNPNVTKVRTDRKEYLMNILRQGHGSVLEHASYTFVLHNVSRVVTHELTRHRAGTAISQESLRYVRLTKIPMWIPDWARESPYVMDEVQYLLDRMDAFQDNMTAHFGLDNPDMSFAEKKEKTSFMRRFAPEGVATGMTWTANIRALRHVITTRTDPGAEEEIRLVFDQVARLMKQECPVLFSDLEKQSDGSWIPAWRKVLCPPGQAS